MYYCQLKKYNPAKCLYFLLLPVLLFGCTEKKEVFETAGVADFLPLEVGKSITYRLDSTVFPQSGSVIATHKYQVKYTIIEEIADNTGQKSYVVQRLINDENAAGTWVNNGTLTITPSDKKAEVTDNNLRVTVLQAPFRQGFSWKGNSQLPFAPYASYDMTTGYDMNKWDFTYTGFGNETYEGQQYNDVWTVEQHNETFNIPPTPETKIGTKEVSIEKYAKGIGLVYKDFQLYEFQGPSTENPSAHYTGFGITMWMIAHD